VPSRDFSGEDVVSMLTRIGDFREVRQRGSHVVPKYTRPETGEQRTVSVPMHDRIKVGTLRSIAEQAGANDFDEFCASLERNL